MKKIHSITVFLICVFALFPSVHANEDEVYFTAPGPDGRSTKTEVAFLGYGHIALRVSWGQNGSNWSVEMDSPLFAQSLYGTTYEEINTSVGISFGLPLNPEAAPGNYSIEVRLKYMDEYGRNVTKEFNLSLHAIQVIELLDFGIPTTQNQVVSVRFKTYYHLSELTVQFHAFGDIEVEENKFVDNDVEPGSYNFETKVHKLDLDIDIPFFPAMDEQTVGCRVKGVYDGRTITIRQEDISIDVEWDTQEDNKEGEVDDEFDDLSEQATETKDKRLLVLPIVIFLVIFNYFYYFHNRIMKR